MDMCSSMRDLVEQLHPDLVVFEDVALQCNAYSLVLLARLQGMLIWLCHTHEIEFYIYASSSWRKALGFAQGRGHPRSDLKQQAIDYVHNTYNLDVDEDRTDAISIGSAFITSYVKEDANG